jgi:hypothetical protein
MFDDTTRMQLLAFGLVLVGTLKVVLPILAVQYLWRRFTQRRQARTQPVDHEAISIKGAHTPQGAVHAATAAQKTPDVRAWPKAPAIVAAVLAMGVGLFLYSSQTVDAPRWEVVSGLVSADLNSRHVVTVNGQQLPAMWFKGTRADGSEGEMFLLYFDCPQRKIAVKEQRAAPKKKETDAANQDSTWPDERLEFSAVVPGSLTVDVFNTGCRSPFLDWLR